MALAAAILVAAASFILLSAAGKTTEIRVQGSVESNYRTAYDILVRPKDTATPLERSQQLIRNNYLSGLFGGITLKQWRRIKAIAGVDVAAPVANIGFMVPLSSQSFDVTHVLNDDPVQLYRLRYSTVSQRGTSRYPHATDYFYYTRINEFTNNRGEIVPGVEKPVDVCGPFDVPRERNVFDAYRVFDCFSARSPELNYVPGRITVGRISQFPVLLAGIDPVEEAKLLQLDKAITSGRYLKAGERPRLHGSLDDQLGRKSYHRNVPVIASSRTYVDESAVLQVERLRIPSGVAVPEILASRARYPFLNSLQSSVVVSRHTITTEDGYARAINEGGYEGYNSSANDSQQYWTAAPVSYAWRNERLIPAVVKNPDSVWEADRAPDGVKTYAIVPPANKDLHFRALESRIGSIYFDRFEVPGAEVRHLPVMKIVGRYDPEKLPGFSKLSEVPLETYYPPELLPADAASRRALKGRPLLPSQNIGDYVAQPPLFLTTLEGMRPFLRPKYYAGASEAAPVSVIRVRVKGVTGPDELSQARVRAVATEIHRRTGLQVDITAGSSPRRLLVELPAGRFGRPKLLLEEGWSKKGVSVSFLSALDSKRLGLLSLILVTSGFFLANGAFAAVRGRRTEIGTLLCLGWSQRAVFRVVLAELVLAGLVAGLAGAGLAAAAARLLGLELSAARALLVVPLALLLAVVAGWVPAWRASRLEPLDAIRPPVWAKTGRRNVRRLSGLALANLRRMPARSLVAMFGLFVGVTALTVLLAVNQAFQGQLVGTLLGEAISVQVRGLDFLTVGLIVALAGLSLADVLYLNLRERAAELVTLRTVGWSDRHLGFVIALEALLLGLLAALAGAAVGVITGASLGVPIGPLALAAAAGIAGGCLIALLASLLPLAHLARLTAPAVLAEE